MADPSQPSASLPLGLLATVGAGAYIAGRYMKKESDSALPSITALAMTFVVFRGLDLLWPVALNAASTTTLPLNVSGISQAFKSAAGSVLPSNGPLSSLYSARRSTVDGYSVK